MDSKIELISTAILDQNHELSAELALTAESLALSSGWHYILDWTWTICQIDGVAGKTVVDAGAGIGLLQWYLASKGANMISIDRADRTCIPFHLLDRFNVSGYGPGDRPLSLMELLDIWNRKASFTSRARAVARGLLGKLKPSNDRSISTGAVKLYRANLYELSEIPDESVDTIVSISALEHNEKIEDIGVIIRELERILVPGGKLVITLPASLTEDWFFTPAYSWCLSEKTLRELFKLSEDTPSNFDQYERIFKEITDSVELRSKLSWRYFLGPNNGMPWGKWDPQYIPVGILKTKQVSN